MTIDKLDDVPSAEHIHEHVFVVGDSVVAETAEHLRKLTPEEQVIEKRLRRKIDLRIMPLCILIYLMNYIDR